MKKVMPFVQATKEKVETHGVKALAVTLEFDEAKVLKDNSIYLANTLNVSKHKCYTSSFLFMYEFNYFQVEEVVVSYTNDEMLEKFKDCCPGSPFSQFSVKPGIMLEFVNPIPHNGLLAQFINISDGDTYSTVTHRLAKETKCKSEYD